MLSADFYARKSNIKNIKTKILDILTRIWYNQNSGGDGVAKNLKLKAARAARDLTQKKLADQVGVSRQTINAIEQGEYNPTIKLCRAICRAVGKTLDELFWEEEE